VKSKKELEMGFMKAPVAAGDFNTYIKYDARAGRWYTKPDGGGDLYEVTNMTAIMDVENIRTGWFEFMEGQAPAKTFDPSLEEAAPKPGEKAKRGFEVLMFSDKNIGGLREFSSTAGVVIEEMNPLYDEWKANKDANPGKLPVVKCEGVTAVKSSKSTNYKPVLRIVAWADCPQELADARDAISTTPAAAPAAPPPAAKAAQHAPPPAAAPAAADDVEF
jgi:hypothetical protein